MIKSPKNVLISVFHKDGLQPIVELLSAQGTTIYSTGGTYNAITSWGVSAVEVESLTSYPSILGGRVKTLHPKVFGGILAREDNASDLTELSEYDIPLFDWVIVDLYPFEETVANGSSHQDIIEKIDIGGISLIRAAAKNYKDTLVVSHRGQYQEVLTLLKAKGGQTDLASRKAYAAEAFGISSHYDTLIRGYLTEEASVFTVSQDHPMPLRYGENPHQRATFFGDFNAMFTRLSGKPVSYNNLMDIESAVQVIAEFKQPTFAIIKHNNTCGLATSDTVAKAYTKALACDNVSAFGGILITNQEVDMECAEAIQKL
ncbi:MAG: bifunctional phosphoribosylaminoimidazolecarboxamide formyltransferase/IMP cyclohydrolase PurH, partial [Bacteroidota bacterium]|nr:bifunctional phosphoribosylaminoimidazolecarboxamide formyltransferase/IMP cyclohydrolase PurH [Bacteroidota bacterium]